VVGITIVLGLANLAGVGVECGNPISVDGYFQLTS